MKIKNPPTSVFYEKLYIKLREFLERFELFSEKDICIIIDNKICDDSFLSSDYPILGMMYRRDKKKKREYTIEFSELTSLDFKDKTTIDLINFRHKVYFDMSILITSPEAIALFVLLHEIGHMHYYQKFLHFCENDTMLLDAYVSSVRGIYHQTMRPWELSPMNAADTYVTFSGIESYAELFAFKHFPYFIELVKEI